MVINSLEFVNHREEKQFFHLHLNINQHLISCLKWVWKNDSKVGWFVTRQSLIVEGYCSCTHDHSAPKVVFYIDEEDDFQI